ncbi:MAG: VCBS repeat-containing protein [Acidobacteria bacterium]|nr:VCBS repeat-containing protein [Acidobacteriota bacterium]
MNWKFRLLLVIMVVSAAVVFVKLPFLADSTAESLSNGEKASAIQESITVYENGVMKVKPLNFAVSEMVRDLPRSDPDALVKSALYVTKQQREEMRREELRKKGLSEEEIEAEDINRLNTKEVKKIVPGAGAGEGNFKDPLVNKSIQPDAPQTMPTPSLTFNGASQVDNASQGVGAVLPPDTNGDVGPNHYVSSVNSVLKMFDKNGNVVAGPIKTSNLFASLPAADACRVQNDGDPIVLYDTLADRWHISQFGLPSGNVKYQCVALSVTGDPTGAYYVWSYAYPITAVNDYPKVGVWTDGYHMTFNQFPVSGTGFLGVGILTQDRQKALLGDPTAGAIYVNLGAIDNSTFGVLPGDIDGYVAPPTGAAEIIGEVRANEFGDPTDAIRMYKWVPDFTNPANSVLTVVGDVPLAPYDARQPSGRGDIEQLGGTNLDSIATRSMHRFAYRNLGTNAAPINSYAGNFSVNVSGVNPTTAATYQAAVRWFEMRRTGDTLTVFDQGTHNLTPGDGANGLNNWMGGIAQDNRGNIAVGFSQSGTTQRADIKIAGRTNNVMNSGTLNEGEALMHAATGSQTSTSNRWGDYSSMSIDPTDDCTFWYTQEYYATTSSAGWSTRVGKFRFPQCVDAPKATITGTVSFCSNGAPVSGSSVDATGGFNRVTGASGTYTITVSPGTYTVSGSKPGGFIGSSQTVTVANGGTATANICLTGVAIVNSGTSQIVSESCGLPNGAPDPGEQFTVNLPLQNTGAASTVNLTATLLATGGVTNTGPPQNFGALAPGSPIATRNFTFTVASNIPCGSPITLTFVITDGATNYGMVTQTFVTGVRSLSLSENFDGVAAPALPAGWANVQISGTGINWETTTTTPSSPPNAAFANEPAAVNLSALVSPAVSIQGTDSQISFKNFFNTEAGFDGMVLEYTTNGGATWTDVIAGGGSFVSGGYNVTISSGFSSPIAGRRAWSGDSSGYIDTVVNLPASLSGQTVQFRWLMGSDASVGGVGVRIDNVQVFGVRVCNTCGPGACSFQRRFDYDGDLKADVSVFRPDNGVWYILGSQNGPSGAAFGISTDKPVPADYDGDGKTDIAVYRSGVWYLQRSTAGFTGVAFGAAGDIPQPADFDGDGKAELAVFRPSNGFWYVYNLINNQFTAAAFGQFGDKPVVGDYDGDCRADYAVFRPSNGTWYVNRSTAGFFALQFGESTDKPVPADYDGDNKTDVAVFRPSNGVWYLYRSTAGVGDITFGFGSDLPVPADYDGDGRADVAVFRPSNGVWYLQRSTAGFVGLAFGASTDKPTPNAFVP